MQGSVASYNCHTLSIVIQAVHFLPHTHLICFSNIFVLCQWTSDACTDKLSTKSFLQLQLCCQSIRVSCHWFLKIRLAYDLMVCLFHQSQNYYVNIHIIPWQYDTFGMTVCMWIFVWFFIPPKQPHVIGSKHYWPMCVCAQVTMVTFYPQHFIRHSTLLLSFSSPHCQYLFLLQNSLYHCNLEGGL